MGGNFKKMNHDTHQNPFLSIICGSFLSIAGYFAEHGFILDFGIDLIKVCIFGLAGGIFGKIGGHIYIKYIRKSKQL